MSQLLTRGQRHFQAPPAAAAVAPPVTPADVAGVTGWYDASDAGTLFQDAARTVLAAADGDPVGGWASKVGAQHLSQATPAARWSRRDSVVNGLGVLRADGIDDNLTGALLSVLLTSAAWTTFCVFRPVAVDTKNPTTYGNDAAWCDGGGGYLGLHLLSTGEVRAYSYSTGGNEVSFPAGWWAGVPVLIMSRLAPPSLHAARDGAAESSVAAGNTGALGTLSVGQSGGGFYQGDLCELVFANVALAPADVTGLTTYLVDKWGL